MEIKILNDGFDEMPKRLDALLELLVKLNEKVDFNKGGNPNENELLSRQATADYFGVDISTIHNWTKKGRLTPYYKGKKVYYRKNELLPTK